MKVPVPYIKKTALNIYITILKENKKRQTF